MSEVHHWWNVIDECVTSTLQAQSTVAVEGNRSYFLVMVIFTAAYLNEKTNRQRGQALFRRAQLRVPCLKGNFPEIDRLPG